MTKNLKIAAFSTVVLALLSYFPAAFAADTATDRWNQAREEEIRAKQAKIDDMKTKIEALSKQVDEERKTALASQEKIWKEYKQGIEVERKTLQEQLSALEDREKLFEAELQKRKDQDEVRIQEKQEEIKSLISQSDFLNRQIEEDRKSYDEQYRAIKQAETQNVKGSGRVPNAPGAQEILNDGSMQIARTDVRPQAPSAFGPNQRAEYYIEIGDVIAVDVWRVPDLTRDVTVRPDGRISMPIVGDVDATGISLTQLREILTKKFSDYVLNPQVSISVRQFGGRKFVILGEVRGPGVFRFQQDISLIEAIALAGGFAQSAKRGKVMIIRGDIHRDPQVKIINANMENLLKKGMLSENITILPNDIIYVTKDILGDYKDIIDNVISPALTTGTDFMVLRSSIRTAQDRRN